MDNQVNCMTDYFRSAVAAQVNEGIDFRSDQFYILSSREVLQGGVNTSTYKQLFSEAQKNNKDRSDDRIETIKVIICVKTIKTIFKANERVQDEIDPLTGVYYVPARLNKQGQLQFDKAEKKLPWFPREYLMPMVEPQLAIGKTQVVDQFISNHVDQVEKINDWNDYVRFFKNFYEEVTESLFDTNTIRNLDNKEPFFELENNMFIFLDKTVNSTFHIMTLYNYLIKDNQAKPLYDNFTDIKRGSSRELIENSLEKMMEHCGQMNGEYALSSSQREAINHFNTTGNGDVLAVNGPPGTGKTTLLQTIVADMYVKKALKKEKPPLIVASSTNNQAVTNIIASFGNIKKIGMGNLEERWIEGVRSFATYFPSTSKIKDAKRNHYHYTNQKGEFFVSDVEEQVNISQSKVKCIKACNQYFGQDYKYITACQQKLHDELLWIEESKKRLLLLAQEVSQYDLEDMLIDQYLDVVVTKLEERQNEITSIKERIIEWENCYKEFPFYVKWFKFIKPFKAKIETEFRLFMNEEEQDFLKEYMTLDEIKNIYSKKYSECQKKMTAIKKNKMMIEKLKCQYDEELGLLEEHHIVMHSEKDERYNLDIDYINDLLDKNHRYVAFWLSVHYYECRWVSGEDQLTDKQKGKTFKNVLEKFYNRLSMITPCLVMTFYMLPKQFMAYGEQKKFFLYNYIDLLIVDEAGQVSPEIGAGAFSLAKKAIVVGDIHQIEPVWSVTGALDKALAISNGVINSIDEFSELENSGLNSSQSSVMKVAAKCCQYEKYGDRGLFLSEHRRCYDEIIDYCNQLVYKGNLQPMRGMGQMDKNLAVRQFPQMGYKQIDSAHSMRIGSSRANAVEAKEIAVWLENNMDLIISAYPDEELKNLVGVITPFKAQIEFIKNEIKNKMPNYCRNISVGTVHTFQGAERRIIILSTVYGYQDGCFFVDANKSLMNVAVSRSKDNFFIFGDINCLNDSPYSASGLLKKCVIENPM